MFYRILTGVLLLTALLFKGCTVNYNLSGGAVSPEVKTISIANFYNESGQGPANISILMTEKVKQYYQNNSRLLLANSNGDWQVEGSIIGYTVSGIAPKANETSGANRLTITVRVNFTDTKDENHSFQNQTFTFYDDYSQSQSLSSVESELIEKILDQIVFDIFQKTASTW